MRTEKLKQKTLNSIISSYGTVKRLFSFRYPKLFILVILIIAAYVIFTNPYFSKETSIIKDSGYLGVFIGGLLFSFGFTAPFAIAVFLFVNPNNIFLAAIIGGTAAMISDLLIFKLIKFSFMNEFNLLKKTLPLRRFSLFIKRSLNYKVRVYLLYAFAGIVIASPLPDEVGVTMLAGLTHIKARILAVLSFCLNSLGILILLLIR